MNDKQQTPDLLLRTRAIQTQEQKIKSKAKVLKQKLQAAKAKKQEDLQKHLKDQMISYYQSNFEIFKQEMQQQFKSQSCSLELIKEFKMSEIIQFQQVVKEAIKYLEKSKHETESYEKQLQQNYEDAVKFLNSENEKQKLRIRIELEEKKAAKVEQYKKTISIE